MITSIVVILMNVMHPEFAGYRVLLLPDGHFGLDAFYGFLQGGEKFFTVPGKDDDEDDVLARLYPARPVVNEHFQYALSLFQVVLDDVDTFSRDLVEALEFQRLCPLVAGQLSYHARESADGARLPGPGAFLYLSDQGVQGHIIRLLQGDLYQLVRRCVDVHPGHDIGRFHVADGDLRQAALLEAFHHREIQPLQG